MNCTQLRDELNPGWNQPGSSRQWVPPSSRPVGSKVEMVLLWSLLSIYILSLLAFFAAKRHTQLYPGPYSAYLEIRPMFAVIITHAGGVLQLFLGAFFDSSSVVDSTPCGVTMFLTILIVPMLTLPVLVRAISFYRKATISSLTATIGLKEPNVRSSKRGSAISQQEPPTLVRPDKRASNLSANGEEIVKSPTKRISNTSLDSNNNNPANQNSRAHSIRSKRASTVSQDGFFEETDGMEYPSASLDFWRILQSLFVFSPRALLKNKISPAGVMSASSPIGSAIGDNKDILEDNIRAWRFLSSKYASFITCMIYFSPYLLASICVTVTNPMVLQGCYGCLFGDTDNLILFILAGVAVVALFLSCVLIRKLPDPFGVTREIFIATLGGGPAAIVSIVMRGTTDANSEWNWDILTTLALFFYCQMQTSVQLLIVWHYSRAYSSEEAQSGDLKRRSKRGSSMSLPEFQLVLDEGPLHDAFETHLINEHGVESLRFLDEVGKWQRIYADMSARTSFVRAKKIVNLYIGESSVFPVNVPAQITHDLLTGVGVQLNGAGRKSFMAKEPTVPRDFFNNAAEEIKVLLKRDGYVRFLRTPEYLEAWNEAETNKKTLMAAVVPSVNGQV